VRLAHIVDMSAVGTEITDTVPHRFWMVKVRPAGRRTVQRELPRPWATAAATGAAPLVANLRRRPAGSANANRAARSPLAAPISAVPVF